MVALLMQLGETSKKELKFLNHRQKADPHQA